MAASFTTKELKTVYKILGAYDEGMIVNPSEEWVLDHYGEHLKNNYL